MRWLVDARPLAESGTGGIPRVARALVRAYAERFPEDDLFLATTGMRTPSAGLLPAQQNCRAVHLTIPNKLWSASTMSGLGRFDDAFAKKISKPIDAVFLPNLGFVGHLRRPYVLLLHDLSFLIEPRWFSPRMRAWHEAVDAKRVIKNASHLLAVSETTKRDAIRLLNIPAERISVIPLGASLASSGEGTSTSSGRRDPSLVPLLRAESDGAKQSQVVPGTQEIASSRTPRNDEKGRFVLIIGGRDPRKNTKTAIAAVEKLKRESRFADIQAVLVGGDFQPNDKQLGDLYRTASVVLYPSWYEGYGLPLHEAAPYGTPCIASTAGALPETAPPGTLFADPAKPHHWAETLREALTKSHVTTNIVTEDAWIKAAEILRNVL